MSQTSLTLYRRAAISRIEDSMKGLTEVDTSPDQCPVKEYWAPGLYSREMLIPKDIVIVGRIHRHAHINIISEGACLVFTEHGGVEELVAPYTFVSEAGTKRVVLALDNTVWTTVHATDKTTSAECIAELTSNTYEDLSP